MKSTEILANRGAVCQKKGFLMDYWNTRKLHTKIASKLKRHKSCKTLKQARKKLKAFLKKLKKW